MGVSRAYLDSFYPLALIKDEPEVGDVKRVLYKLKSHTFDVFVPFIVLGEVCGVVFRDFKDDENRQDKMAKLVDIMIDNKIGWENLKPTESDAFDIMVELNNKDESLDPTDVMILAHVLSDPDSKFFFTTDSNILENEVIIDLEKRLRREGKRNTCLKIRDRFENMS